MLQPVNDIANTPTPGDQIYIADNCGIIVHTAAATLPTWISLLISYQITNVVQV